MTTSSAADRNLLFGILAVQMDFVTQDRLILAMNAWVLDKQRSLGELLIQQGDLSPERRTLLEALVDEHLKQHHQDVSQSLAAISSVTSAREALGQIPDEDVQASLAGFRGKAIGQTTEGVRGIISETQATATPTISIDVKALPGFRYQILRPYAKGGLGEVLVARDQELNREVALKQIQNERADDPDNQARFLIEAEITGGLEHPGIVPVYGLGHYDNGRPYYAMRFIRGDSLKKAIERFHQKSFGDGEGPRDRDSKAEKQRSETERNLELRSLLGRFIDVCNAIAYAHSRGVLHRDLKPDNIMLGKFGETLVVDWGLAKPMSVKPSGETTERQLEPPSGSGSVQTLMGSAVGTPQYMSPEQAAGNLDQLGPASDVYSLGATLYCLLTGQAPFEGRDVGTVLKQVQDGAFSPPRQIDRRISRSLQAICLKAMALNPKDRYESPRDLADDVESWLADEPTTAYQESFAERAARWGRRHKPWIVAGAVLLLTAVFGLTISTLLINSERQITALALTETEKSRHETAEALAKARAAEAARIEGQVDALLKAQSESVPSILSAIEPVREKVRPLLQQQLERTDLAAAQVIRLQLALLRDQPELVEELRQELLQARADDFAMIRAGVAYCRQELRAPLWETLRNADADQSARFRAACALAAFDPNDSRWAEVTDDVATWLVHENPLVLGTWVEMLEPVREKLLPALARQFQESHAPEIRSVANTVIGRWAADQVDLLVGLLLEADPRQFVSLVTQLQTHKDAALAKCRATLNAALSREWPDPPRDLPNPEPRYAEWIEQSGGLITETLAFVQTLPLSEMEELVQGLRPAGYRPVRLRPYRHQGKVFVAVIWHRDHQPWRLETALAKEALLKRDEEYRKEGFAPMELAGYVADQTEDAKTKEAIRYAAVWVQSDLNAEESQLLCGLDFPSFTKAIAKFNRQSNRFSPVTLQVLSTKNDDWLYNSIVQIRPERQLWQSVWGATKQHLEIMETPTWTQVDVSLSHLRVQPKRNNPFQRELDQIDMDDQGSGLGQAYIQPYKAGMQALGEGQNERAVEQLSKALNTVKLLPQPYYLRSLSQARLGKATEAKQDYIQASQTKSRAIPLLTADQARSFSFFEAYTIPLVSAHLGEPEVGEQMLGKFLDHHQEQPEALYMAARAFAKMSEVVAQKEHEPQDDGPPWAMRFANRAVELLQHAYQAGFDDTTGVLVTQPDFDSIRDLPSYGKLIKDQQPLQRYALIWHYGNVDKESRRTPALSPPEHLAECRKLIAEGFRMAAISVSPPVIDVQGQPVPDDEATPVVVSIWQRPLIEDVDAIRLAQHQANAALAVWHLDPQRDNPPAIREVADPQFGTEWIARCAAMKIPPRMLIERLSQETDPLPRQRILLALGGYDTATLPSATRQSLVPTLVGVFRDDPDPGVHSAAEWLLRQWGLESQLDQLQQTVKTNRPRQGRKWYLNGQGQTLAVVEGPVEFLRGAPPTDRDQASEEWQHRVRIQRSFAVATTETTVAQYLRFDPDVDFVKSSSPDANGPIVNVDWFDAVKYCRWLSEQEGIEDEQMCYPPVDEIGPGMELPANFLERTGYRLPTEAEWEFAARAGVDTKFTFGNDTTLLPQYAWFKDNADDHAHRVGLLKPNRLGLFDVMGNAGEWCHDEYMSYRMPPRGEVITDHPPLEINGNRVGRGGSILSVPRYSRLSTRFGWGSKQNYRDVGFRIVRTLPNTNAP